MEYNSPNDAMYQIFRNVIPKKYKLRIVNGIEDNIFETNTVGSKELILSYNSIEPSQKLTNNLYNRISHRYSLIIRSNEDVHSIVNHLYQNLQGVQFKYTYNDETFTQTIDLQGGNFITDAITYFKFDIMVS